jgi:hypothetical protein
LIQVDASDPVPTLAEFLACCHAECEFLVREFGFTRLPSPLEHNLYSVCFRKGDLGVDVYGENWGATASCDLRRKEDRLSLGLLIPAAQRAAPRRKRARRGQLDQIKDIAVQLKLHAADFLGGDARRLDAALAEWRRVTRPRPISEAQRLDRERQQAVTAAGHASKRADWAEVVRLLQPHEDALSLHQRRMLEIARARMGERGG